MTLAPGPVRRVAFFGSPAFALPVLEAIVATFEVVLVVAQPDKPAGRGMRLTRPAVAAWALERGLPLEQPARLRGNASLAEGLRARGVEVAVTCAYGKILPADLLAVPPCGFINVHTSLLPRYRGAAPIQWTLISGERETGVTIMQTDPGLDTGPILLQEGLEIDPLETALELAPRLSALGARLVVRALGELGSLQPIPQDEVLATLAPLLTREDGRLRWSDSSAAIHNRYRGVAGWPGSWFTLAGRRVKVLELRPEAGLPAAAPTGAAPGTVLPAGSPAAGLRVAAGSGVVELLTVQPEGRARMGALEWARGHGVGPGTGLE